MREVFPDFVAFMEQLAIPAHEQHPDAKWLEPDETKIVAARSARSVTQIVCGMSIKTHGSLSRSLHIAS